MFQKKSPVEQEWEKLHKTEQKFLQGIPIIGAVGGICDAVYMKRITEYANSKYKKRFLMKQRK